MTRTTVAILALVLACKPKEETQAPEAMRVRVTKPGDAPATPESDDIALKDSIADNCLMGAPALQLNFGSTTKVGRSGYALAHSNDLKIPLWVCEHITEAELAQKCNRGGWFKADDEVPESGRAKTRDYARSGFDRGHMAPSEDFSFSCDEMKDSFFLSNMAPQVGVGMNQHVWKYLEERVREWVESYGEAWVVTGPVFLEDDEGGLYCASTIGPGEVGVPDAFYKAIVVKRDDGKYQALGFILQNEKYSTKKADHGDFSDYAVTIDEIEEKTGIDLFPSLTTNVEGPLESADPDLEAW